MFVALCYYILVYVICYTIVYNESSVELDIADTKCTSPDNANQLQREKGDIKMHITYQTPAWSIIKNNIYFVSLQSKHS